MDMRVDREPPSAMLVAEAQVYHISRPLRFAASPIEKLLKRLILSEVEEAALQPLVLRTKLSSDCGSVEVVVLRVVDLDSEVLQRPVVPSQRLRAISTGTR